MHVDHYSSNSPSSDGGHDDFAIELSHDDLVEMAEGASAYEEIAFRHPNGGIEQTVGIEVILSIDAYIPHEILYWEDDGEIFDDALDALLHACAALKDIERGRAIEDVKDNYEIEKAMRTFTYYDKIRRGEPTDRK